MGEKSQMQEKWIEIARAGRFRDSGGGWHEFTPARLENIAKTYDPARREAPLVIGHPATDGPAHGWIARLKFSSGKLLALPAYVSAAIKAAVDNGLYKHVSMSLYDDDGLRHVGILGATPPAIDGLAPISFSGDAAATFDFDQQQKGFHMTPEELNRKIAELEAQLKAAAEEKDAALKESAALKEQLAAAQAELAKSKEGQTQTAAEFAAFRDAFEKKELAGRLDRLVASGRIPPAEKEAAASTAEALRQAGRLNFAAGGPDHLEVFLKSLEARPVADVFSNFSAPPSDDGGQALTKSLSAKL